MKPILLIFLPLLLFGMTNEQKDSIRLAEVEQASTPEEYLAFKHQYPRFRYTKIDSGLRHAIEENLFQRIVENPTDSALLLRFLREQKKSSHRDTILTLFKALRTDRFERSRPYLKEHLPYFRAEFEKNQFYAKPSFSSYNPPKIELNDIEIYQLIRKASESDSTWDLYADTLLNSWKSNHYIRSAFAQDERHLRLMLRLVLDGEVTSLTFFRNYSYQTIQRCKDDLYTTARYLLDTEKRYRRDVLELLYLIDIPEEELFRTVVVDPLRFPELYPKTYTEALATPYPTPYDLLYGDHSEMISDSLRNYLSRYTRFGVFARYYGKRDSSEVYDAFWNARSSRAINKVLYTLRSPEEYKRFAVEIFQHPQAIRESMTLLDRRFETFPKRVPGDIATYDFPKEYIDRLTRCEEYARRVSGICECFVYDDASDFPFPSKRDYFNWVEKTFGKRPRIPRYPREKKHKKKKQSAREKAEIRELQKQLEALK